MKILIVGDSITEGELGFDYIHLLKGKFDVVSKGLGGETLFGMTEWLYDEVQKEEFDQIIIEIGHNDIILPILKTKGWMFKKPFEKLIYRGSIPTETSEDFGELYRQVITNLKQMTNAPIAVTTLGLLNENQESISAKRRIEYNRAIRKLGNLCDVIDIGEAFDFKIQLMKQADYFLNGSGLSFLMDKKKSKDNYGANELAFDRGLYFTMDGIHLSESGAQVYNHCIEEFLVKKYMK